MATFGNTSTGAGTINLVLYRVATIGMPVNGDGTVDSIFFYARGYQGYDGDISAGLYAYEGANDAGTLIKQTETKTYDGPAFPDGPGWAQLNFTDHKPSVTNNTNYYICVEAEDTPSTSYLYCYRITDGGPGSIYEEGYQATLESPWENEVTSGHLYCVYASYTPGGVEHTHSASDTLAMSDSLSPAMTFNVAASDTLAIGDALAALKVLHHSASDTLSISDSLEAVLIEGEVVIIPRRKRGVPYGLKPARVPKIGRIGV